MSELIQEDLPTPVQEQSRNREETHSIKDLFFNALTILVLLAIVGVIVVVMTIYFNPKSSLNPFPPPELPQALVLPTAEPTQEIILPSVEPTLEPVLAATPDAAAAQTEAVIVAGTPLASPEGPTPTATRPSTYFAFDVQSVPTQLSATLYDSNRACNWLGVAGRVFDLQNRPVKGIRIHLKGFINGKNVDFLSLTGTAVQYGPSGYEFTLGEQPVDSYDAAWVQLLDQSDLALSEKIYFDTSADCSKNLILIDFKQVR